MDAIPVQYIRPDGEFPAAMMIPGTSDSPQHHDDWTRQLRQASARPEVLEPSSI